MGSSKLWGKVRAGKLSPDNVTMSLFLFNYLCNAARHPHYGHSCAIRSKQYIQRCLHPPRYTLLRPLQLAPFCRQASLWNITVNQPLLNLLSYECLIHSKGQECFSSYIVQIIYDAYFSLKRLSIGSYLWVLINWSIYWSLWKNRQTFYSNWRENMIHSTNF